MFHIGVEATPKGTASLQNRNINHVGEARRTDPGAGSRALRSRCEKTGDIERPCLATGGRGELDTREGLFVPGVLGDRGGQDSRTRLLDRRRPSAEGAGGWLTAQGPRRWGGREGPPRAPPARLTYFRVIWRAEIKSD